MPQDVLTPAFELHLRRAPGLYAAALDRSLRPETTRVLAAAAEPDSDILRVAVSEAFSARFLRCLDETPRIAVTAADVHTYQAFQCKGQVLDRQPAQEADLLSIEDCVRGFLAATATVGVDPVRYRPTWVVPPFIILRVAVDAVFDQTPRRGAGALVGSGLLGGSR